MKKIFLSISCVIAIHAGLGFSDGPGLDRNEFEKQFLQDPNVKKFAEKRNITLDKTAVYNDSNIICLVTILWSFNYASKRFAFSNYTYEKMEELFERHKRAAESRLESSRIHRAFSRPQLDLLRIRAEHEAEAVLKRVKR